MKFVPIVAALALLISLSPARAGRPLATDDAGTTPSGACQLESWVEHSKDDRALVIAPACGIAPGWELGVDYTVLHPRDAVRAEGGLALKWVPEAWQLDSPAGELNFGLKLGTSFERPAQKRWHGTESGVLLLATLVPNDAWAMHVNLGAARNRPSSTTALLLSVALAWQPSDHILLFTEAQLNDRQSVFGNRVHTAGARWWAVKDRFGIDLTASQEAGSGSTTTWTVGFGWYGLSS